MKLKMKILVILILMIMIMTFTSSRVYSADPDIFGTAKNWIEYGKDTTDGGANRWSGFNSLAGILWGVGVFVVLIGGVIIGIKYMFSSLEEKADLKANLVPYVIGAAIILGALSIWRFSVEFLGTLN